jgi:ribonuclease P protein component
MPATDHIEAPEPVAPAPSDVPMSVIRKRADFLRAASARRHAAPSFLLQGRDRGDGDGPRVGFTCSKKVGNAVARNFAKRRLREAARLALGPLARLGWDYVLVGRPGATATRDFAALLDDVRMAVARVHGGGR